jgi:hypothetical protein
MKRLALVLSASMLSAVALAQTGAAPGPHNLVVNEDGVAYSFNPTPRHDFAIGITNRGTQAGVEFWTKGDNVYGYLTYIEAAPPQRNEFVMSRLIALNCTDPDWFWSGVAAMTGYGYFNGRPSFFDMVAYDALYGAPDVFWFRVYQLTGALIYERVVVVLQGDIRVLRAMDD